MAWQSITDACTGSGRPPARTTTAMSQAITVDFGVCSACGRSLGLEVRDGVTVVVVHRAEPARWSPHPDGGPPPGLDAVTSVLDPVLVPLGFAAGQAGGGPRRAQVIYCRGVEGSPDDGCLDLVLDLEAAPDWRVVDVRWWGFTSDRWHLPFERDAPLADQLAGLARTLPATLADG